MDPPCLLWAATIVFISVANIAAGQDVPADVRWTYQLQLPISDFATLDLDADSRTELLCGAGDKLYALEETSEKCGIVWHIDLGATAGSPVIVDLDDDGKPEILLSTADGRLHCLRRATD